MPVIHLIDTEQVLRNVETCLESGINEVFLINHVTDHADLLEKADLLKDKYPDLWLGLNFLGIHPNTLWDIVDPYDGIWTDHTLTPNDVLNSEFEGEVFSGLNFKYQKQYSGDELLSLVETIKKTSTVACTSGVGTGKAANIDKIKELKGLLGDFRLALASGVSSDNIEFYIPYVDYFLVASSITDHNEIINKIKLRELVSRLK